MAKPRIFSIREAETALPNITTAIEIATKVDGKNVPIYAAIQLKAVGLTPTLATKTKIGKVEKRFQSTARPTCPRKRLPGVRPLQTTQGVEDAHAPDGPVSQTTTKT